MLKITDSAGLNDDKLIQNIESSFDYTTSKDALYAWQLILSELFLVNSSFAKLQTVIKSTLFSYLSN